MLLLIANGGSLMIFYDAILLETELDGTANVGQSSRLIATTNYEPANNMQHW